MNEKLQYAEMLEIPVSSVNITYKPVKKKKAKRKKEEEVKQDLINMVNSSVEVKEEGNNAEEIIIDKVEDLGNEIIEQPSLSAVTTVKKKEKKKGSKVIVVQLAVIGALIATIFLTSALLPSSGINTFINSVFNRKTLVNSPSLPQIFRLKTFLL